jgi:hypothetical protein
LLIGACTSTGTVTCGTSDDPTEALFVMSVAAAAGAGFAFGFGPLQRASAVTQTAM